MLYMYVIVSVDNQADVALSHLGCVSTTVGDEAVVKLLTNV